MRAHFSRTVRAYMHASETYSHEKIWNAEENKVAELVLGTLKENTQAAEKDIVRICQEKNASFDTTLLTHVWKKLHTFPHVFEVAEATGKLMDYDLSGNRHTATSTTLRHITYCRWKLRLADLDTVVQRGTMSESMWEFIANVLRIYPPH